MPDIPPAKNDPLRIIASYIAGVPSGSFFNYFQLLEADFHTLLGSIYWDNYLWMKARWEAIGNKTAPGNCWLPWKLRWTVVPYTNRIVHFNHEWPTKFRSKPVDRRGNNLKICIERERDGERDRAHCLHNCTRAFSLFNCISETRHKSRLCIFKSKSFSFGPSLKITFVLPGSMCEDLLNKQCRCCTI